MTSEEAEPYVPMSDAYAPPKEDDKETFTSDIRGIERASEALEENRAAEKEIVERRYVEIGGEHHGKPVPENQTIDIKRAVDDLTRQRNFEDQVEETVAAANVADATDQYRARKPRNSRSSSLNNKPTRSRSHRFHPIRCHPASISK